MATAKRRRVSVPTGYLCDDVIGVVVGFLCVVDAAKLARTSRAFRDATRQTVRTHTLQGRLPCMQCDRNISNQQPPRMLKVPTMGLCNGHCPGCCLTLRGALVGPVSYHIKGRCIALPMEVLLFMRNDIYRQLRHATCIHFIQGELCHTTPLLWVARMVEFIFERTEPRFTSHIRHFCPITRGSKRLLKAGSAIKFNL
jgi:hypothetical protein